MKGAIPVIGIVLCLGLIPIRFSSGQNNETVSGLQVPDGFKVLQVADDDLATNVYCMTVSPRGETYVSGPGYIKALIDSDGDGVFDQARQFANGPATGAQGMCFDGNDLICTGDQGLLRFSDANRDGVADGQPELIFPIKCGGEHHAHAIRKGPDGWWYLLAGNQTPIRKEYYAGKNSPVINPRAGFLMRISPDWNEKEIFAHGFRNAYDFDFNSRGHVFVYDSDGERDISLPWYRPTRVFRMRPGDDAGWVKAGWKRPSSFLDMPIEIGALGRGSPTGVVVNTSKRFPAGFDDAIFVADWTFGRVVVFRRNPKTESYDRGTDFVIADGQFGFAVTDLDFDRDGSLLVSVGGRGTRGGIYKISSRDSYQGNSNPENATRDFVLTTTSRRLKGQKLVAALSSPLTRDRAAALESLVGRRDVLREAAGREPDLEMALIAGLRKSIAKFDSTQAGLVLRIVNELEPAVVAEIDRSDLPLESSLILKLASARTEDTRKQLVVEISGYLANEKGDPESLCRIGQLALGGCGANNAPEMFVGYTAQKPVTFRQDQLDRICRNLTTALDSGATKQPPAQNTMAGFKEIGRLASMLGCSSEELQESLGRLLASKRASVPQQIHWLNCLSQTAGKDGPGFQRPVEAQISDALIGMAGRIEQSGLNTDRNFYPRMKTLVTRLFHVDDGSLANRLALAVTGERQQVYLFDVLPKSARELAITRFASHVEEHPEDTASGQIQVLASHSSGKYLPLIRRFAGQPELRAAVVNSLSKSPHPEDREIFASGLGDSDLGTVKNSAIALRRIFEKPDSDEVVNALKAARRLGWDKPSVSVRDQLMLLLQKHSGQEFGYRPKQNGIDQGDVLARISAWVKKRYPTEFVAAFQDTQASNLTGRMQAIDWDSGDTIRGQAVYKSLQCAQCHDAGSRLGPRLEGIAKRFGRDDLFRSIVSPNQQVPQRYRALVIETVDGQLYRGSVVYESVDGITLQDVNGNTIRLNRSDIDSRNHSTKSLMPEGLLNEATDQDIADLMAFLKSQ